MLDHSGMGSNARRRREQKALKRAVGKPPPVGFDEEAWHRAFRSTCSDCGSARIEWLSLADLVERREEARRLLPLAGASASAWVCSDCGNFGAFEQEFHFG